MKFFTNKHVITAFIVTPILALGGYYAVDLVVKEKPQPAVEGQSYPLSAKSNCRYTSGECDLQNAEFKSQLVVVNEGDFQLLTLSASHALQDVKVGFRDMAMNSDEGDIMPVAMNMVGDDMKSWSIEMPMEANEDTQLMVAMLSNGSHYYAETTMAFSEYKTSFNKNFKDD